MEISLYYREQGTGEPMLLLHGNGDSGAYFEHQIAYFGRTYRVLAVDTRGHGQSPRGTAPFSIAQFAADLYDFMKAQQLPHAVILGFSDGANIAMAFAMQHPEMVSALILNGGNLTPHGVKPSVQIPIEIGYCSARLRARWSEQQRARAEMLGLMVHEPHVAPGELAKITAPTLVISGTDDMIKESDTRKIAANIPGARLVLMEGNHFIAQMHPEEFNRHVAEFLNPLFLK